MLEEEEERRRFQRKSLNQGMPSGGMSPEGFGELVQQIKSTEAAPGEVGEWCSPIAGMDAPEPLFLEGQVPVSEEGIGLRTQPTGGLARRE